MSMSKQTAAVQSTRAAPARCRAAAASCATQSRHKHKQACAPQGGAAPPVMRVASPKSASSTSPSRVSSRLEVLMSRCSTRCACRWSSASSSWHSQRRSVASSSWRPCWQAAQRSGVCVGSTHSTRSTHTAHSCDRGRGCSSQQQQTRARSTRSARAQHTAARSPPWPRARGGSRGRRPQRTHRCC